MRLHQRTLPRSSSTCGDPCQQVEDDPTLAGALPRVAPHTPDDLPDRWTGHLVEWSGWRASGMVLVPPLALTTQCPDCADRGHALLNVGRVSTDPAVTTVTSIGLARGNRGRHPLGAITAHRCAACPDMSSVIVTPSGHEWQLDAIDYLEEDSWDYPSTAL